VLQFVVDGNWVVNDSARKEDDGHGIVNNVLLPEDIVDEPVHTLSSAAPASSTAALAGAVPKETEKTRSQDSLVPGAFPETPAVETPGSEPQTFNIAPIPATSGLGNPIKLAPGEPVPESRSLTDNTVQSTVSHEKEQEPEAQTFGVAPIPATAGAGNPIHLAPGEKVPESKSLTDNTVQSTVSHEKEPKSEAQIFGVAPIPATAGAGNPIKLAPGEPVPDPSTFTSNTIHSTVKTDPASYAKSDAFTALPDLGLTPQAEREAKGGMFALPPVMGNMIPESSLPMGADAKVEQDTGVAIQSAAPLSTTAMLAGQVPKEPRGVPDIVSESRKEAGFAPEATSNPIAVMDKKEVEQELKDEVPVAPAAADNSYASQISSNVGKAAAATVAGATVGAGLFTAAVYNAKDKAVEAAGVDPKTSNAPVTDALYSVKDKAIEATGVNPNTSNAPVTDALTNTKDMAVEAGTTASSNATAAAFTAKDKALDATGLNGSALSNATSTTAGDVPAIVSQSQKEAHIAPEASANAEAVNEKRQVEQELLSEIPKTTESGISAPAIAVPAIVSDSQKQAHVSPEAAANTEAVAEKKAVESELLSEIPKTNEAGAPAPVLTALTSATAPGSKSVEAAPNVPDVVAESQKAAHISPEAAANTEAVGEKKAVEAELLKEIKKVDATGAPAPITAAGMSQNAAALSDEALVDSKPLKSSSEPDALNAPASKPATTFQPVTFTPITNDATAPSTTKEPVVAEPTLGAPTTTEQTKPTVTTGTETTTTEAKSGAPVATTESSTLPTTAAITTPATVPTTASTSAPATEATSSTAPVTPRKEPTRKDSDVSPKGTPGSQSIASGVEDKKKKRRSIFGKIKDKLSSKN
jgi:hypothetical protein